jgi:hypothetical protein
MQMNGVLPWLVRWAHCPALAALVSLVKNIFFLTVHYFTSFVPIAQPSGQVVVLGRFSLNMCLFGRRLSSVQDR